MGVDIIKVQAIINPVSGVGSKRKIPKMLEDVCRAKGCFLSVVFTEYAGHAIELTKKALEEDYSCIIAVGGDGTVNEIARTMIYSDAVLGIIPKGSGNGLARELHIPMDVKRAIDMFIKGHVRVIDACDANGRIFFCTCGVGFDAKVSQSFAKEKHRGSLTYIKNTIEEYLNYKPEPYELLINNQTIKEKAFLVACGNASQYGNNAFIAPHANIQDGEMDITLLSPFTPLDIAPLAIQLFTKQIDRNSKIKVFKAKNVSIIRQHPGLMHLDGEPIMVESRIDISVMPKALKVFSPEVVSLTDEVKNVFEDFARFFENKLPTFLNRNLL
ncbi:MAG: diacylglycerol kinase family lipid kinase [Massilibacteroides sp.]|nr:diacylglycerol kinase family lipid kinase [Massilibacteroides sp.]MDD3062719.1 diacylglycerol kinase family lipid kinase [Massilibacteroides sp.]MDD4114149.1 diacylglycerol kinase family lipid kinase [Massilibacteroides sp.]MDD4660482.1 diacylglycerol kinase family lipid kinase [Massilibacteroides sp.]